MLNLELISRLPSGSPRGTPLLFVHGAFAGAWIWDEYFLGYFARRGYPAHALSLRGHGLSEGRRQLATARLSDYVADVAAAVARLGPRTVLVGHSMGGAIVQHYLSEGAVSAAVLMASVPPHGLLPAATGMLLRNPAFFGKLALLHAGGPVSIETVREALFGAEVSPHELRRYATRMQAESQRVTYDLMFPSVARRRRHHPTPMLVLGAQRDVFVSPFLVEHTARFYSARCYLFPRMGHAMMLERRWRRVAGYVAGWLDRIAEAG